jgi:hypothetical protein
MPKDKLTELYEKWAAANDIMEDGDYAYRGFAAGLAVGASSMRERAMKEVRSGLPASPVTNTVLSKIGVLPDIPQE